MEEKLLDECDIYWDDDDETSQEEEEQEGHSNGDDIPIGCDITVAAFHPKWTFARGRKMQPIDPANIATSYRRICFRDFKGVEDKYHTAEQRERTRDSELYEFCVRSNDTLDAMEEEQAFSAVNFASCAYYLEQFVCSLGRVMLWEPHLKLYQLQVEGCDMRQGLAIVFAQKLLGTLDFTNDTLNHEFLTVSSTFMKEFFQAIPPKNVLWYQVGTANPILMTIDE
jgi:hypothetical protein